jgi:cytoskeleton protein RodZ
VLGPERMTESDDINQTITAGERLRAAREAKKLSLEDIATQTRIPLRHLDSLEKSEWVKLPAQTYTIGFAKSYASAVGLDRNEIADDLRVEMGGQRPDSTYSEVFEPADPARTMPKWLVLGAVAAIVLLVVTLSWFNNRSLEPEQASTEIATAPAEQAAPTSSAPVQAPPAQPATAAGPVVLTATEPAWVQVTDQGNTLFSGELVPGQNFTVPQGATAPLLKAGKPEALRITVGTAVAPPVGPPGKVASKVSLVPADLMRGGGAAAAGATPAPPAPSAPPGVQNRTE